MAAVFPGAVSTQAQLRVLVNNLGTQLNGDLTSGATTITVDDTTGWPTSGYGTIDSEIFSYTGKTGTTFSGVTRGVDGTSAVAHNDNTATNHYFIADHHNHMADEIIAVQQNISDRIGLSTTQLMVPNGSAAAPSYSAANFASSGMYFGAGPTIEWAVGGSLRMTLDDLISVTHSTAGTPTGLFVTHTNNTSGSSHAKITMQAGGASGGDAYAIFSISGATTFALGVDNSDSDKFKLSGSGALGTSDYLTCDTSGNLTVVTGSLTVAKTTNQIILGVTNTVTITSPAPASSAVYTIADVGTSATFVMTAGTQTIGGAKTFSSAIAITATSNHLVLSTSSNTLTISAATQATSARTWTVPDVSGNGTFAALEGTQTFTGAKTFSANVTVSKSNPATIVTAGANTTPAYVQCDTNSAGQTGFFGVEGTGGGALLTGTSAYSLVAGCANNFAFQLGTNNAVRLTISGAGSIVPGTAALATNATDGFVYLQSCAGTPTGTPTAFTGRVAWVYDSTNNIIYIYNGAWKKTIALL